MTTTSTHADEHRERLDDDGPRRSEPTRPATAAPAAVQVPIARSTVSALGEE